MRKKKQCILGRTTRFIVKSFSIGTYMEKQNKICTKIFESRSYVVVGSSYLGYLFTPHLLL